MDSAVGRYETGHIVQDYRKLYIEILLANEIAYIFCLLTMGNFC